MENDAVNSKEFEGSISFNIDGALAASLKKLLDEQTEYFRTLMYIKENSRILEAVSKNSLGLTLSEQLRLYRAQKRVVEEAVKLNDKYKFIDKEEDDECY